MNGLAVRHRLSHVCQASVRPTSAALAFVGQVTNLRLTHPDLDFWIDVRLREFDGRWLAVADLADTPDVGLGETAEEALRGALASLGGAFPDELTARVFGGPADAQVEPRDP